ncbi:alpha/beta fold hydrolase [Massiliimalia massiliensis]|uniref:alpha/beta fold hydrolase n=1 Tax=Massiliimalia massiliensis TaxID=1852384 RepID=UPI0013563DDA|nr:alpha/beta hydrolase [Massiliimalia massiliensis]
MGCAMSRSNFLSSNGTDRIAYYIFRNEDTQEKPKAILQISHGMCEYFLRYSDFAAFLTQHGYIVCGNDHLGHGDSVKNDDYLGYFAPNNGWKYLVQDVHRLTLKMKAKYPDIPLILMGHSMGSFITRLYIDQFSDDIDGVMIVGTNGGNPFTTVGITLAKQIRAIRGEFHRSSLLQKLTNAGFNSKYPEHYSEHDWLSRDKRIADQFAADEKCGFTFTASAFLDLFTMIRLINRPQWGQMIRKDLPAYLFAGDNDPVGDYGKGVARVYQHLNTLGIEDLQIRLYPGARHEVLNEINKEEVYQDVLNWLDQRFAAEKPISKIQV